MLFLISIFLLFFGNAHLVPTPDPETALATPASPTESQKPAFADEIMKTEQYLNQVDPIEVLALGRSATFGTIYDAREDSFKEGVSMFTRSETDEKFKPYVTSTENREAKIIYSLERSMADKLKMMDIKAELKVSLMSDTIEVSGSGRYFKDEKKSEKICKAVLLHSISTVYEEVTVTDKDLVDLVDMQALDAGTHVVVGIDWGGNLFLTITDTNKEDKDTQVIEGALSVTMKKASLEISGNATVNITNEEITKRESYMFSLDGDILPDQNPKTLNEVIEFMKNSPEKLRESNNGRGKQVKYTLLPVEALKRLWNKQGKIGIVGTIEKDAVQMAVNVFDQVNKCEQKLNDLNDDKEAFRNYLPNNIITDFEKIYNSFTTYKISLKSRFADEVKKARYGNYVDFKRILNEFKNQEYSHRNILLNYFKLFGPLKQELSFLKLLKGLKVEILHKENYLLDFVFKNEAHDVYVLIYNFDHPNELNDAINVFRMISQNRKDPKYENAVFGVLNYKILATKPPYKEITEKPAVVLFQHQSLADKQVKVDVTGLNDTNVWGMGEMKEILNKMKDRKMHSPDFHYVQYPDMSEPSSIWPQYKWEEVKKYQNAFFRVFKDKVSAPFGSIQEAVNPSVKAKAYVSNNFISGTAPQIGNGKGIFAACPSWDRPCPMHELVPNKPMTIAPFLGNDIKSLTKAKIVNPDNVAPAYHSIRIWKIIQ